MTILIYVAVAIAFLVLVAILFAKTRPHETNDDINRPGQPTASTHSGPWLDLSERIFNPSDARWLEEELAFPQLANLLTAERKRLAVHWLESLRHSFDEIVRTPEAVWSEPSAESSVGSWQLLWLTLRFQILVNYALWVVKLLGPYHRLVPSFAWFPFSRTSEGRFRRAALANSRGSD